MAHDGFFTVAEDFVVICAGVENDLLHSTDPGGHEEDFVGDHVVFWVREFDWEDAMWCPISNDA